MFTEAMFPEAMRLTKAPYLSRLRVGALALAIVLGIVAAPQARADYPDRTIKIVVPFAPGGGTDLIARRLADEMAKDLGQTVIIENRPGAGTIVGTQMVANSAPDGYTLLMATFAHAVNPSLNANLPFDTFKAFAPVSLVARSFNILVTNPKLPYRSVADLIAAAKTDSGKLNFGSFGIGTSAHLAGEMFKNLAKVDITHVTYRGSAPAMNDLLGGQIQIMFTTAASVAGHIQTGQLRALAVTSADRSPVYPALPTIAEAGVPGYVAESWYGLYAPAGTPSAAIDRLNKSVAKAVQSEAFKKLQEIEGLTLVAGPPAELERYVKAEAERWQTLIRDAKIKAE